LILDFASAGLDRRTDTIGRLFIWPKMAQQQQPDHHVADESRAYVIVDDRAGGDSGLKIRWLNIISQKKKRHINFYITETTKTIIIIIINSNIEKSRWNG
jgi:hypothetical protein